jgi:5-methylcytosine-specific restriction endonuclease McrA
MKICNNCQREGEFRQRHRAGAHGTRIKNGHSSWCLACERSYHQSWYRQTLERQQANRRANYQANKDAYKARAQASVQRDPERRRAYERVYMANRRASLRSDLTVDQWKMVVLEFGGKCAYCQEQPATEMDHFWPVTMGGETTKANVVPACMPCNRAKFNHDPLVWLGVG